MRACAIINANLDVRGLSLINFNLTTFMGKGRQKDALFILSLWAIEPVRKQTQRFIESPKAGEAALIKRTDNLIVYLKKRSDASDCFIENATSQMTDRINKTIYAICQSQDIA